MTTKITLLIILVFVQTVTFAQISFSVQPGPIEGKDALLSYLQNNPSRANTNYANHEEFVGHTWTVQGNQVISRSLIDFDSLHTIPQGSTIILATLELFGRTQNEGSVITVAGTQVIGRPNNDCVLRRVTSSWDESTVTWNNQPSVSNMNQVSIPGTTQTWGYNVTLDIKTIVQDLVNLPESMRHGFLISITNENDPFASLLFSSSDNPNNSHAPKLTVQYATSSIGLEESSDIHSDQFKLFPNPTSGEVYYQTSATHGNVVQLVIYDWTGKKLLTKGIDNSSDSQFGKIELRDFNSGLYLVEFTDGQTKVLKQLRVL